MMDSRPSQERRSVRSASVRGDGVEGPYEGLGRGPPEDRSGIVIGAGSMLPIGGMASRRPKD